MEPYRKTLKLNIFYQQSPRNYQEDDSFIFQSYESQKNYFTQQKPSPNVFYMKYANPQPQQTTLYKHKSFNDIEFPGIKYQKNDVQPFSIIQQQQNFLYQSHKKSEAVDCQDSIDRISSSLNTMYSSLPKKTKNNFGNQKNNWEKSETVLEYLQPDEFSTTFTDNLKIPNINESNRFQYTRKNDLTPNSRILFPDEKELILSSECLPNEINLKYTIGNILGLNGRFNSIPYTNKMSFGCEEKSLQINQEQPRKQSTQISLFQHLQQSAPLQIQEQPQRRTITQRFSIQQKQTNDLRKSFQRQNSLTLQYQYNNNYQLQRSISQDCHNNQLKNNLSYAQVNNSNSNSYLNSLRPRAQSLAQTDQGYIMTTSTAQYNSSIQNNLLNENRLNYNYGQSNGTRLSQNSLNDLRHVAQQLIKCIQCGVCVYQSEFNIHLQTHNNPISNGSQMISMQQQQNQAERNINLDQIRRRYEEELGMQISNEFQATLEVAAQIEQNEEKKQNSNGLIEEVIQKIFASPFRKKFESKKSDDDTCPICFCNYEDNELLRYLKCKHRFHACCLDPWLRKYTKCPVCRHAV